MVRWSSLRRSSRLPRLGARAAVPDGVRRVRARFPGRRGRCHRGVLPADGGGRRRDRAAPHGCRLPGGRARRHGGRRQRARACRREAVRGDAERARTFVVCLFDSRDLGARRGHRGRPPRAAAHRCGERRRRPPSRDGLGRARSASSAAAVQAETQVACIRAAVPSIERVVAYCRTPETAGGVLRARSARRPARAIATPRPGRRRDDHELARPGAPR